MKRPCFLAYALLLLLAILLTACSDAYNPPSDDGGPIASPTPGLAVTSAQEARGAFREYSLPQNNSGLMRPAIDARGRVWFGEMNRNYLASFDPKSGKFWQETPPNGKSGIMGIIVAPDDTIWFAEQYADYIGHYFPATDQYRVFQLSPISVPDPSDPNKTQSLPRAPNNLVLDQKGYLWFSEINANEIGRLNTTDGTIRRYPLPLPPGTPKGQQALNPYGITVDPQGIIWFSTASAQVLGRLNPQNGQTSYFIPANISSALMEVASDSQGQIWATTFTSGLLLRFNPGDKHFTIYRAPSIDGNNGGGLYSLAVAANGDIWVVVTAAGLLARLDVKTQQFFYYIIPTRGSLPIGIVIEKNHAIWFTESGSNKLGMLLP